MALSIILFLSNQQPSGGNYNAKRHMMIQYVPPNHGPFHMYWWLSWKTYTIQLGSRSRGDQILPLLRVCRNNNAGYIMFISVHKQSDPKNYFERSIQGYYKSRAFFLVSKQKSKIWSRFHNKQAVVNSNQPPPECSAEQVRKLNRHSGILTTMSDMSRSMHQSVEAGFEQNSFYRIQRRPVRRVFVCRDAVNFHQSCIMVYNTLQRGQVFRRPYGRLGRKTFESEEGIGLGYASTMIRSSCGREVSRLEKNVRSV